MIYSKSSTKHSNWIAYQREFEANLFELLLQMQIKNSYNGKSGCESGSEEKKRKTAFAVFLFFCGPTRT